MGLWGKNDSIKHYVDQQYKAKTYIEQDKIKLAVRILEKLYEENKHYQYRVDEISATLGDLYYENGPLVDYEKAIYWYSKISTGTKNYKYVQFLIGRHYSLLEKYDKAREYYEKAGNEKLAINNLGYLYENGLGVERNIAKALRYYALAHCFGCDSSSENIKRLAKSSMEYALTGIRILREGGETEEGLLEILSTRTLDEINQLRTYLSEEEKYGEDDLLCLKELVRRGELKYCYALGNVYRDKDDDKEAVYWYKRSAKEKNDSRAWYKLSFYGTDQEKRECLENALATKHTKSTGYRNSLIRLGKMRIKDGNLDAAKDLFREAIDRENMYGYENMAKLYSNPSYAEYDLDKAMELFLFAITYYEKEKPSHKDTLIRKSWFSFGMHCLEIGDYKRAERIFLAPEADGYIETMKGLVSLYLDFQNPNFSEEKAITYGERACKIETNEEIILKIYDYLCDKEKYNDALFWCLRLDQNTSKERAHLLGLHYLTGKGVCADYHRAIELFEQAVYSDGMTEESQRLLNLYLYCPDAKYQNLWKAGDLLSKGWLQETEKYYREIKHRILWKEKEVDYRAFAEAFIKGKTFPQDYATALLCIAKALTIDIQQVLDYKTPIYSREIQSWFDRGYKEEHLGRDYREAVKYYRKAANHGHVLAMYRLSDILESLVSVTDSSEKEKREWEEKAKAAGCPFLNKDVIGLLSLALHGSMEAMEYLHNVVWRYMNNSDAKLVECIEIHLLNDLAKTGDPKAMMNLFRKLRETNPEQAYSWLTMAAESDNGEAMWYYYLEYGDYSLTKDRIAVDSRARSTGYLPAIKHSRHVSEQVKYAVKNNMQQNALKQAQIDQKMLAYDIKINQEERFKNLIWSDSYLTNAEMYVIGETSFSHFAYDSDKREKRREQYRKELESED